GLARSLLIPGGRCQTPERRTGSFDSIGRVPWGPRSSFGRWSQPLTAIRRPLWLARAPTASVQKDDEGLTVGVEERRLFRTGTTPSPPGYAGAGHPGGHGETGRRGEHVASLTTLPASRSIETRAEELRVIVGLAPASQGLGSNPSIPHRGLSPRPPLAP